MTVTIAGNNDAPVLTVDQTGAVTEDATTPNLTDSGTLSFTDVDVNDTHTTSALLLSGPTWSGGTLSNVLTGAQITALTSGFTVDANSWDYTVANSLLQFLREGETVTFSFTVTVTDNSGQGSNNSDSEVVTVTITGNNDAPVLTVDQTGAVAEDATTPNLTDSGTLSFTDVDVNDTHTTSALLLSGPTWSGGTLSNVLTGAQITALTSGFTVDANSWDYTVANSLLQFLGDGETITFSFTVTVTDNSGQGSNNSDSEVVTVTIGGNNHAPVLTVDQTGAVTEDATTPNLTDSGTLSFTDVDVNDTHTTSALLLSGPTWSGGTLSNVLTGAQITALTSGFTVDANSWDYTVANSLLQFLREGETITFSFTVTVTDNSGQGSNSDSEVVTVTITGNNDAPVLTVDQTGAVTEDATTPNLTDSGTLSFTDVDVNDTHTTSALLLSGPTWSGGTLSNVLTGGQITALTSGFTVDANSWDYTVANSLLQFLREGETITFSFTVTVTDNSGQGSNNSDSEVVTVTITGNNDAPVLTVDQTGAVAEDATTPNLTDSGTLSFTDVDVNDTHTTSALLLSGPTWSGGTLSNVLTGAQITALTSGFTVDANSWDYTVANSLLQFLGDGETITFSFTVTVTDNSGQGSNNSDSEVVTVTIGGNNHAPVLTVDQTGAVTEDATTPNLTDSGTLSFTDVDVNDTHTTSALLLSGPTWSGGTLSNVLTGAQITALTSGFTVDANSWDYTVANSLLQFLREGETITFSFTVTVTDNSGQGSNSDSEVVTVTITGNNDAPVLTVDQTGAVTEDATTPNLTDSGTLSFTDVDVNDTHTTSALLLSGPTWSGGTLSNVLTGAQITALTSGFTVDANSWDYTVANSLLQFLREGETVTFSFTVTVTDNSGQGSNNSDSEVVTVTITGNNDAPVLTVDQTGAVAEDATTPNLTDSGTLSFTDVDVNDTHTTSALLLSGPTWSGGTLSNVLTGAQITALTSGFTVDANSWDYTVANSLLQFLGDGETITFSFTVTVTDNSGQVSNNSDSEVVTVTIGGNNHAPVLTVDQTGAVTEDATTPNLTDSGTLSFTDVDVNDTHTTSALLLSTRPGRAARCRTS